jgi:hypothetical protein
MFEAATQYYNDLLSEAELMETSASLLSTGLEESNLIFGNRLLSPFLRPYLMTTEEYKNITYACETIWQAIEKVKEVALTDNTLLDMLGLSPEERELVTINPGYTQVSPTARLDSFLTDAAYSFVELNGESPAGIAYADAASKLFLSLPVMERFMERYVVKPLYSSHMLLEVLLRAYQEFLQNRPHKQPQIAIVDLKNLPTQNEFELFKAFFEREGYRAIICSPEELSFNGQNLHAGNFRIDIVYKRLLVNEYLPLIKEYPALLNAYRAGAVCIVNSFRSKLVHKKAIFSILTDEQYRPLFTSKECETIVRHVPWTRHVRATKTDYFGKQVDLLDLITRRQSSLVLKPNDDYGGRGIYMGWNCDQSTWNQAINDALKDGDYLVQERVPTVREVFPSLQADKSLKFIDQLVDLDPLLFYGKVGSVFARLSSTELANVSSGGGMVPAFIVAER